MPVYLVSSIHWFKYGSVFTRPCLNVSACNLIQRKTEHNLNKFQILKPDYSSCTRGSKSSSWELTKRVFEIVLLKTLTTKSTKSHFPIRAELSLSARYLLFILLSINVCLNSWKKKNLKKPSANFEAFCYSFYWSISFKVGKVAMFCRLGY